MIGYDVGDRLHTDVESGDLLTGADPLMGLLDAGDPDDTGSAGDFASALNAAADVAGRMRATEATGEGLSADASVPVGAPSVVSGGDYSNGTSVLQDHAKSGGVLPFDAMALPPFEDFAAALDSALGSFSAQNNLPTDQSEFGRIGGLPAADTLDLGVANAVQDGAGQREECGLEGLDGTVGFHPAMRDFFEPPAPDVREGNILLGGQGGGQFDAIMRSPEGAGGVDDPDPDRSIGGAPLMDLNREKIQQVLPVDVGEIFSGRPNESSMNSIAGGLNMIGTESNEVPDVEVANGSHVDGFGRLAGQELGADGLWAIARKGSFGSGDAVSLGADHLAVPSAWSAALTYDAGNDAGGMSGLAGLWAMLTNAERALPKAAAVDGKGENEAAGQLSEGAPAGLPGSFAEMMRANIADHRDQSIWPSAGEHNGPAVGRVGPTGHRNDPIYTVAISSNSGTPMPQVPTSGTSMRTPPIPGQRNLP